MARHTIDYGIDLGTTNSAIARMASGRVTVLPDPATRELITPSCVYYTGTGAVFAGQDALNLWRGDLVRACREKDPVAINGFIEFKRTMGTEKVYPCPHRGRPLTSEELSAELLKRLRAYAGGDEPAAAVITVPARFRQAQVDATQRAAELAGFTYCELLSEPIAASLAYGLTAGRVDGYWVVFDLGGGTFDTVLMKVDDGLMKVVDTAGDNHLGGKNLDYAVVDEVLLPWLAERYRLGDRLDRAGYRLLLREALKPFAEQAKIELSARPTVKVCTDQPLGEDEKGKPIELDLELTADRLARITGPFHDRAVALTVSLLERNRIAGRDLETLVLVGGPTRDPRLRDRLRDKITKRINDEIDPMTAVAAGAAIFSSLRELPNELRRRDRGKVQLILKYPGSTVEPCEALGVKIDRPASTGELPDRFLVEVARTDRGWSSGRVELAGDAEVLTVPLVPEQANTFGLALSDGKGNRWPCEPERVTILHGMKAARATLPFAICLDVVATAAAGPQELLYELRGLPRNQPLPAVGKGTFRTLCELRPGRQEDCLRIPIYEGEPGTRAVLNEFAGMVVINGTHLPGFLPAGSEVEITLEIDASRRKKLRVYFPHLDETVELTVPELRQGDVDLGELTRELEQTRLRGGRIASNQNWLAGELAELATRLQLGGHDFDTRIWIRERLREVHKQLDAIDQTRAWPEAEAKLERTLARAKQALERYGEAGTAAQLREYEQRAAVARADRDLRGARDLEKTIRDLDWDVVSQNRGFWLAARQEFNERFETINWKDRDQAKQYLAQANRVADPATLETLRAAVLRVWWLIVFDQQDDYVPGPIDLTKLAV